MIPERAAVERGVGIAAMCAARIVMGAAVALAAWGVAEASYGMISQPQAYEDYNSTSDPGYLHEQSAASEHVWQGASKIGASTTAFLASWTADIIIMDRRQRRRVRTLKN